MTVDWAQPGETVENLVAVLLRRENPMATQIRPSRGDGGIDVRVPAKGGGIEIYQIKKFRQSLSASQLQQIKESFDRLNEYRAEHSLDVRAWHLLMPLNPTNENHAWLDSLATDVPFPCDWRGTDYLDGLAAKFPEVVDYYLHDGADRLERVVAQMVDLMKMSPKTDGSGLVTPAQVMDELRGLQPLLDTDPHFLYAISLDPAMPNLTDMGAGFVAALCHGLADGGAVTVKIYPKFAEALGYRPIPGSVKFKVEPGSALEQELEQFSKYGTPIATPPGSVDFVIDLPGGLGGSFEGGSARIGPSVQRQAEQRRLRLVAVDPSGTSVDEVLVDLQTISSGFDRTGMRLSGTDTARVFDIEMLLDLPDSAFKLSVKQRDLTGRAPAEVLEATRFLSALRSPNQLVIAQPFGPANGQEIDLSAAADWLDFRALDNLLLVLETLAAIQAHTPTQIVMPAATTITADAVNAWLMARRLLEGEQVALGNFTVGMCMKPAAEAPTEPFSVAITSDFAVSIGEQSVDLGPQITHSPMVEVVADSVRPHDDHQDCTIRSMAGAPTTIQLVQSTV